MYSDNYERLTREDAKKIIEMYNLYGFKYLKDGYRIHFRELNAYAEGYDLESSSTKSVIFFLKTEQPTFSLDKVYRVVIPCKNIDG